MSFTKIFILVLVFAYISCFCNNNTYLSGEISVDEDGLSYIDPTASKNSCINRQLSPEEEEFGKIKCCYLNADCDFTNPDPKDEDDIEKVRITDKYCLPVSQREYDNLKDVKKKYMYLNCKTLDIECNSSYLGLTIIFLILNIL